MPVTIRDVARQAGVGLGTVSRVLNNSPLVSEGTRQRVLEVITELDYVPSPSARRLSLGKTHSVAVIVSFLTRPVSVERLRGVASTMASTEYDLVIYHVETPERRDACFRDLPRRERVDGVLILSLNPRDQDVAQLAAADVPIVLVDASHPALHSLNQVIVDDVAGGRVATQHLIELGHHRIGFVGDEPYRGFSFSSSADRLRGYRQALETAGVPFRPDYCRQGKHGRYEARRLAGEILAMSEPPTAIFAASDTQAMGVLEAARDCGLRVPQDLSVVGYDDIEVSEFLGLTTIRQLLFESGEQGVQLLLAALDDPSLDPVCRILPTDLVVRNTSAPPR